MQARGLALVLAAGSLAAACSLDRGGTLVADAGSATHPDAGGDGSGTDAALTDAAPSDAPTSSPDAPPDLDGGSCSPGAAQCAGGVARVCTTAGAWLSTPCAHFGACSTTEPTRCAELVPANVGVGAIDASAPEMIVSARTLFDTDLCASAEWRTSIVTAAGGVSVCVVSASRIVIEAPRALLAMGTRPLVLVSATTVDVDGAIDVSARAGNPGAGGAPPRMGAARGADGRNDGGGEDGGGGGGGFCGAGGDGGDGGSSSTGVGAGGAGGGAAPSDLTPLSGGAGGGRGTGDGGVPGASGGLLQISAREAITVRGRILASGGGGRGGTYVTNAGAGGGGGSGGGVLLEAPSVVLVGGVVRALGGGGGGGAIAFVGDGAAGENGVDALADRTSGGGSAGVGAGNGGAGGGGAVVAGDLGSPAGTNGGGAGGGAGCIRIGTADAVLPAGAAASSPNVGPGLAALRPAHD